MGWSKFGAISCKTYIPGARFSKAQETFWARRKAISLVHL